MENTATLNLRVNSQVKHNAEDVLGQLGISMSTAVGMFLRQVALTRSIPFPVALPPEPRALDANAMSDSELAAVVRAGLSEAAEGVPGATVAAARGELL